MENKSNGALIGSIIVIVILIVGGIYLYKTSVKGKIQQVDTYNTNVPNDNSTSNIEADLNNTDLNLDSGL